MGDQAKILTFDIYKKAVRKSVSQQQAPMYCFEVNFLGNIFRKRNWDKCHMGPKLKLENSSTLRKIMAEE